MLFNSLEFALFLPIVFLLYWFACKKNIQNQNILILISSYIFYGWWDWRFLSLIFFSSCVDYFVGISLDETDEIKRRKKLLYLSLFVNLGLLGVFKYYNFFAESFQDAFTLMGSQIDIGRLNIILPVGISFYTFQTLSYSIDVYKKKLKASNDPIAFFAYVSFFPQLVAGPIERAVNLLPQFSKKREFDYHKSVDGLRQILWGLFKKIVIADNCATYADLIFNNAGDYSGSTLLLGAIFFTFQIYGDFSGYSDIAIGTARLLGFDLMRNFAFPYFSRDIAEFWRRWHISLSTWFRDYLYIPLGGSRGGKWMKVKNTFIIFIVSGFWHGANWTFIIWGAVNALYFLPLLLRNKNRRYIDIVAKDKVFPSFHEVFSISCTFLLCVLAWIIFRAESVSHLIDYYSILFSSSLFTLPEVAPMDVLILLGIFIIMEWLGKEGEFGLSFARFRFNRFFRWLIYVGVIIIIFYFGNFQDSPFIYFQF